MREMLAKITRFLIPLLLTSAVAGAVLAILAPLGTHRFSALGRFGYWIGLCMAGGLGAGAVEYALRRMGHDLNRWPLALMQSLGATAAVSLFVFQIHYVPTLLSAFISLFYIWVIAMAISAIGALQRGKVPTLEDTTAGRDMKAEDTSPTLMSRLKPALRQSVIYALEAQDHYVRVVTNQGDDLLLMRLSDAIAETAPLRGLSPHRSWWVAEAGVKNVVRHQGKIMIYLKNDNVVPVSRSQLRKVRDRAWL